MFDVKQCEKEIGLAIFKREIGIKKIDIEETAERIRISTDMLKEIFKNNGEFYTPQTFMFWAAVIALSKSPNAILDRKRIRKKSRAPQDRFYKEVWEYIADLPNEEAEKINEDREIIKLMIGQQS